MIDFLGYLVIGCPILTLLVLSLTGLFQQPLPSIAVDRLTKTNVAIGLLASIGILIWMLWTGNRIRVLDLGNMVDINEEHLHFHLEFIFDRLSVPMILMSFVLIGVIGSFANIYLQADSGYHRFFLCFSVFLVGLIFAFLAGTIETLFVGWELVGLSSALLIAYFHERPAPVQNGLRVWAVYRVADAAFLAAAIAMHHQYGQGEFAKMTGSGVWPEGVSTLDPWTSFLFGILLLIAAAGKSGLIPFSGWLPRAMEGPTPSSAVFYGALSIHLGAYLLLRISPIFAESIMLRVIVVLLGASTAIVAAAISRVQTDVKSALAYSSVCQVGIIVMEIGFGWWYLALIHMIGHAFLRSLQLLRAPTLLRDYRSLENAIGGRLAHQPSPEISADAHSLSSRWYRFALERGYMDAMIDLYVVRPFCNLFHYFTRLEDRWMQFLSGETPVIREHYPTRGSNSVSDPVITASPGANRQ
ncbi:MAG: proton-conducting transporter membrane subunit [Planctomycetota bacterium]